MSADVRTADSASEPRWCFGRFVLWESQRRLERDGQAVRLGSRAFDLLLQLLKRRGEVIGKDALHAAVWPDVVVEEASVRVHMSTLRKALGEPAPEDGCHAWIANVPLRGYRFLGQVRCEPGGMPAAAAGPATPAACAFAPLPARLSRLIGRDAEVERLCELLGTQRLVTLVGTGGIGKTSAAICVARQQRERRGGAVAFVDLAPLVSPAQVPGAMAAALGLSAAAPDPLQAIVECLAGQEALLLVDNCEHVIGPLSGLVGRLLAALPRLRILATSREALRVESEVVLRLPTLALPGDDSISLEAVLRSPAGALLVERAEAAGAGPFDASHRTALARICRQTDGIPLAIELVAARLGVQSIDDLALRLDAHMLLCSVGSRCALARHRTLAAALDWSIALLDEGERRLLGRLSLLDGRFDIDSALAMAKHDMDPELALDALMALANKSIVAFDPAHARAPYRLLDTTRCHAQMRLLGRTLQASAPQRDANQLLDFLLAMPLTLGLRGGDALVPAM